MQNNKVYLKEKGYKSGKCFGLRQMTEPREDGNELVRLQGVGDFLSS